MPGAKLIKEGIEALGQFLLPKVGKKMKVYHGSRTGEAPIIDPLRPFYTGEREMAESYAGEAAKAHGKAPYLSEYEFDPSGYMQRDEYQALLDEIFPGNSWTDKYHSEAATVEDPSILEVLRKRGVKGVQGLWDFDMLDSLKERQVNVTLDPSSLAETDRATLAQRMMR